MDQNSNNTPDKVRADHRRTNHINTSQNKMNAS